MKENIETLISKQRYKKKFQKLQKTFFKIMLEKSLELICVLKGWCCVYGRFGKTHQDTCYK